MNYDTEQRPSLATHLEVVVMMAEHTVWAKRLLACKGAQVVVGDGAQVMYVLQTRGALIAQFVSCRRQFLFEGVL